MIFGTSWHARCIDSGEIMIFLYRVVCWSFLVEESIIISTGWYARCFGISGIMIFLFMVLS